MHRKNLLNYLTGVLGGKVPSPDSLLEKSIGLAVAFADEKTMSFVLRDLTTAKPFARWQMVAMASLFDALERQGRSLEKLTDESMRQGIRHMIEQAQRTATDAKELEPDRLAALRILGREPGPLGKDLDVLAQLLHPQQAAVIQNAAANALGRIPDQRAAAILIAGWITYTPALKSQTLDLLLSRDNWQPVLLRAIEKKDIPAPQIDAHRRQRLLSHRDDKVSSLAARLFEGAADPDRRKILRDYQDVVSIVGDIGRGKMVFAKRCASCHMFDGAGPYGRAGPCRAFQQVATIPAHGNS